uniref:Fatty acyl-CoA reductase n=1 Tax=Timema genevievae TaxID=629358 RepID=A0A7R9K8H1_TIMGE|nr:unnamed protein product [Timema genevievae]
METEMAIGRKAVSMADPGSPIAEFYRGRCIMITGATGFMGKVLVEKLLRSCPDIANIYLLMRPKRGTDVMTRLDELTSATGLGSLYSDEVYLHLRGGRMENLIGKPTFSTPDQESNLGLPFIGSQVYSGSSALDHAAIEADSNNFD